MFSGERGFFLSSVSESVATTRDQKSTLIKYMQLAVCFVNPCDIPRDDKLKKLGVEFEVGRRKGLELVSGTGEIGYLMPRSLN